MRKIYSVMLTALVMLFSMNAFALSVATLAELNCMCCWTVHM